MPAEHRPVRVGVVDSGIHRGVERDVDCAAPAVLAARAFVRSADGHVQHVAPYGDGLGHGSAVAALIADGAAQRVEFVDAQVFAAAQAIDAGLLAEAIDWCVENAVRVLNLSLGLRADRPLLRKACARANAAGVTLVAACPARGGATFPAAYPQVLAVSGDARCLAGGWSVLADSPHFGASPCALQPAAGGGASFAAARISGVAAAFFSRQPAAGYADLLVHLRAGAGFIGRECRS